MPVSVIYSKRAQKDISKLDNIVKKQIKKAIETKLLVDPIEHSVKLRDFPIADVRRMRIGNYRIIFSINRKSLEILRVGHRREIYR